MADLNSFLGTGWGFPPAFDIVKRGVGMTSDEEDIEKSIEILLATTLGERVMQPDYGSNLGTLLFEPMNTAFKAQVRRVIIDQLYLYESRIVPEEVKFEEFPEEGFLRITVIYRIPAVNSRRNLVYPFYFREATSL